MSESAVSESTAGPSTESVARPRRPYSRFMMLLRRMHLYAGLLMLPWVLMYGVTGAMYNHQGLFPRAEFRPVRSDKIDQALQSFPTPQRLAQQVVDALQQHSDGAKIELAAAAAEFTNDISFEVNGEQGRDVVYIDPVDHSVEIGLNTPNDEKLQPLLTDINNVQLSPNPQDIARQAATAAMQVGGRYKDGPQPRPFGWTKLNFIAQVDGQPARVTYVLKDGHIDVSKFDGNDGMPLRHFLLRLHTTHGQPPHWNGRMLWSLAVDTMAIAMVLWAGSGILMWWQIKRTRLLGAVLLLISAGTATFLWFSVHNFYAATRL